MGHLILQRDAFEWPGFSLLGESSLAITMDDTGPHFQQLDFLVLNGTSSVSIASSGNPAGINLLPQLEETTNGLTTVTISGSETFELGSGPEHSNTGDGVVTDIAATAASPTTIHSSLTLIDASATTGDGVVILAGATNTSGAGQFDNGGTLNSNVAITYTGLTIKGGSGAQDFIENDAKNGIVTEGNGNLDAVNLGGAGAKATLGSGTGDEVTVGFSQLLIETAGSVLGDKVTFGAAATAELFVFLGAEAGSTAGTSHIGLTKVLSAADGMRINFSAITNSGLILDETAAVASATTLTAAENAAVKAMASLGVAYFDFGHNEYFVATHNVETAISSNDAIVELVGITNHHATNSGGLVTLTV